MLCQKAIGKQTAKNEVSLLLKSICRSIFAAMVPLVLAYAVTPPCRSV